jgi:hypothetical protein
LGAGKPLAHQVSPKRLLGSGACGLLEIFLKQQICYWTGVLCTGRQLADARLVCGVYSPFHVLGLCAAMGNEDQKRLKALITRLRK